MAECILWQNATNVRIILQSLQPTNVHLGAGVRMMERMELSLWYLETVVSAGVDPHHLMLV